MRVDVPYCRGVRRSATSVVLASVVAGAFAPARAGETLASADESAAEQEAPETASAPTSTAKPEPFAFADFSWAPGNYGAAERPLKVGPFTGELRVDTAYHYSFNRPQDDTISGSSEVFRHGEFQVTQFGIGGDLNY